MSSSVLVLGAGGFIGRHLADALVRSGSTVIAATRSPIAFPSAEILNVVAPFDEPKHFAPLLQRCDSVIHAASNSTPSSSAAQPQLDGNLRTTLSLIEALQDNADRRLVYLSSGGTLYGDRDRTAQESDPLRPRSYHGAGKAAAEHFIHAWTAQYEGTAVALRPSNVYGPGQLPRRGFGVIPAAFDCVMHDTPLTIWGTGATVRDYLYVDDLVALCRMALQYEFAPGMHVFNAAFGAGTPLEKLLDAIDRTTGRPLKRDHRPARAVDVRHIVPDSAAARDTFSWQPETTLHQGLQQTWRWMSTR